MQNMGWMLVAIGGFFVLAGVAWLLAPSLPWLGRLPGDIAIERGNVRIYFPLVTSLVLSVVLTGILWLVRYFMR